MTDITTIPTNELVDDYYASQMDKMTCERVAPERFKDRIRGNADIMRVITRELGRRGELDRIGLGGNHE